MKNHIWSAIIVVVFLFGTHFYIVSNRPSTEPASNEVVVGTPVPPPDPVPEPMPPATPEMIRKIEEERTYLLGHFDPAKSSEFIAIPLKYTMYQNQMYLRKETYDAFLDMRAAALKDGVNLKIASAARNFNYQKNLWNNKWNGTTPVDGKNLAQTIPDGLERFKKILEYSAAPGTSRHHWGTDIDINTAEGAYFDVEPGIKEYNWLVENASLFGFCQPYTAGRSLGYNEEKWHWSYVPVAGQLTKDYAKIITPADITGFEGATYVQNLDLINDYVLEINPLCR
ncbi:MAG TPA: M15 family metallopeptidase [Candidatus Paceibacterota bacterium]